MFIDSLILELKFRLRLFKKNKKKKAKHEVHQKNQLA